MTNITAALTAVLMDKAKELLDRNLPGFADRYEQVAHTGDAPTSGPGMGQQGFASGYTSGGQATPMTYRLRPDSRQMVVIAAGGHQRAGTDTGDAIVAFALPE